MKTKLLLIIMFIMSNALNAQDIVKNRESKDKKAARIEMEYRATEKLIDSTAFVLTADFLSNQYGYRKIVQPMLNFIEVDSSQVIIQTGNDFSIGYNGIGGLTVTGKINSWDVKKDSLHKSFFIRMGFSSSMGFYDVFMNVNAAGKAHATISGTSRGELNFEGSLCPLQETRTYRGSSI